MSYVFRTGTGNAQELSYATDNNQLPFLKTNQEVKDRAGTCADQVDLELHQSHFYLQGVSVSSAGLNVEFCIKHLLKNKIK